MSEETWIWGRHPVLEALRAGSVVRLVIASGRTDASVFSDARAIAGAAAIHVEELPLAELERRVQNEHTQGIAAQIHSLRELDLHDLLIRTRQSERTPFLLALDQIQDPHNLGALLRTADAAGVHGVLTPDRRSAPLSGTVAKVSAGAISYVNVSRVTNLSRALLSIKESNIWVVGLDGEASESLYDLDLSIPLVMVLGNEGSGLRRLTRQHCDFLAHLPMAGHVGSLNASVAGSIAMYEVVRQRSRPGKGSI